jgi:hypothetical protein
MRWVFCVDLCWGAIGDADDCSWRCIHQSCQQLHICEGLPLFWLTVTWVRLLQQLQVISCAEGPCACCAGSNCMQQACAKFATYLLCGLLGPPCSCGQAQTDALLGFCGHVAQMQLQACVVACCLSEAAPVRTHRTDLCNWHDNKLRIEITA